MPHITHHLLDRPIDTDPFFDRVETHYTPYGIDSFHFYVDGEFFKLCMTPNMKRYINYRWYLLSISRGSLALPTDLMQELEEQNAYENLPAIADNLPHIVNMAIDRAYCTLPTEVGNRQVRTGLDKEPALNNFRTTDRPGAASPVYLDDFRVTYNKEDGLALDQERYGHWWRLRVRDVPSSTELQQILGDELDVQQIYTADSFTWFMGYCFS